MNRTYDLFEVMDDGGIEWRCAVPGLEDAILKLKELAARTENEVHLMDLPTKSLVAVLNARTNEDSSDS